MKQVAQNYKSGELAVLDVPVPACKPGGVLVRSLFSLISTGTEMMKVSEARLSLLGKARARPDQVRKLLDSVAQQGAVATYQKAMQPPRQLHPARLLAVRRRRRGRAPAPRSSPSVSSSPPRATSSPCTPRSTGCRPTSASRSPRASRRSTPPSPPSARSRCTACAAPRSALGETACRHRARADRSARRPAARRGGRPGRRPRPGGRRGAGSPRRPARSHAPRRTTRGSSASSASCASGPAASAPTTSSSPRAATPTSPVEIAARLARDRGRVVDIGKTRLDLPWNAYYDKELDVRFSRSYGPGRYDDRYELDGVDYPAGYVRWTERRNLACFLDLLAVGSLDVAALVSERAPGRGRRRRLRPDRAAAPCRASGSSCPTTARHLATSAPSGPSA